MGSATTQALGRRRRRARRRSAGPTCGWPRSSSPRRGSSARRRSCAPRSPTPTADAAQKRGARRGASSARSSPPTPRRCSPTSPRAALVELADLLDGIEELGHPRRVASRRPTCRRRGRAVRVRARRRRRRRARARARQQAGDPAASKGALVDRLLARQAPAPRRSRSCATSCSSRASAASASCSATRPDVVADQRGFDVATVTTAAPLTPAQLERLSAALSRRSTAATLRVNTDHRPRRASAACACRSATTSSTAASPRASATSGRSSPADAG